jgi:hypothetical protein
LDIFEGVLWVLLFLSAGLPADLSIMIHDLLMTFFFATSQTDAKKIRQTSFFFFFFFFFLLGQNSKKKKKKSYIKNSVNLSAAFRPESQNQTHLSSDLSRHDITGNVAAL